MVDEVDAVYRFRGHIQPTAEVKRPVCAYRNQSAAGGDGDKPTTATIDIFDVIDSWGGWWGISAGEVDAALASIGDIETLFVRVNSPGGEATEGIAIANLLRAHAATIHVTVYGLAASAASYISTAGDTVAMAPGSMMMIHDAWNVVRGDAAAMRATAAVLDTLSDSIASLYALKAGGTAADWRAVMVAETWYGADDAVSAGLADKVGIDQSPPPVNGADQAPPLPDADGDGSPFDRAAKMFDLSVFEHAPSRAPAATAVPTHSTATSTTSWDGPAQEKNLKSPLSLATAKKVYAWYDGGKVDNGQITKANCKFPHHFVGSDGTPGKASTKACQSVIAILNGGMGGADIPSGDRQGVYDHVAKHLRDADLTPAPLDTQTPAAEPGQPTPKEADAMSDTIIKGLRERLGIADDAKVDEAALLAEYDKQTTAALAALEAAKPEPAKADEPEIPEGMTLVSETLLATLQEGAAAGIAARAKQNGEDRDKAIEAAFAAGKISAAAKDDWSKAWDLRPEQTAKELASLGVRFPVAKATGYAGDDGTSGDGVKPYDDAEATAMAELTGAPKEAFLV